SVPPAIVAAHTPNPAVRVAAVLDFPDRRGGAGLYAFVEAQSSLTEEELVQYLIHALGKGRAPEYVHIVGSLPRTSTGQIRGDILRLVSTNQVCLMHPLVTSPRER